jgi:cysteine desulfurase
VIYLDYNATTPLLPEVFEAMRPYFLDQWGNASSPYRFGLLARAGIENARCMVADLIAAEPNEILFTSGATEANNTALRTALHARPEKRHVIVSKTEHSSVLECCESLERGGFKVTYLPVDQEGQIDPTELEEAISNETAIVSVMWANNETGVLLPIEQISEVCRQKGVPLHCDAVQAAGKVDVDVRRLDIDYLSISAHKIYGPKGVGALFVRTNSPFEPFQFGGHQEGGRRGGTENVALIAGFGVAAELARRDLNSRAEHARGLRDELEELIRQAIPEVRIYGANAERLPNTSNLGIDGIDSDAMVNFLDSRGICVSSGSACMSGALGPSHVILAMTGSQEQARQVIRFSVGRQTTSVEVAATVEAVNAGWHLLRV